MKRFAAITVFAVLVSGCGNVRPGYETLDFTDTGVDVPTDTASPDARHDTGVMPDVIDASQDVVDDAQFADAFTNGSCAAGDAMACPAAPHATVTCESSRCVARCVDGYADCDGMASNGCETSITTTLNCGACGITCPSGAANSSPVCTAGTCGISCSAGYSDCDGMQSTGCEIRTAVDALHCGTCGTTCASIPNATATCTAGTCSAPCMSGYADCNANTVDGCETQTSMDLSNCGMCGRSCSPVPNATVACTSGTCTPICNAGTADCDHVATTGCETTITTDLLNCGSCGSVCSSGPNSTPHCASGTCSITCATGFADCNGNRADGCEVALNTSAANCGTCGHVCTAAPNAAASCSSGTCQVVCNSGFSNCDANLANGCEIATSSDLSNCGTCGTICTGATNASPRCSTGSCTIVCVTNYANCDGMTSNGCEINTQVSPTNCGTCGTVCPSAPNATPTCSTGICNIRCVTGFLNCDGNTLNGCETPTPTSGVCP